MGDGTVTSNDGLSDPIEVAENTSAGLETLRYPSCPPEFPNRRVKVGEVGEGGFDLRLRLCNIIELCVPCYQDMFIGLAWILAKCRSQGIRIWCHGQIRGDSRADSFRGCRWGFDANFQERSYVLGENSSIKENQEDWKVETRSIVEVQLKLRRQVEAIEAAETFARNYSDSTQQVPARSPW